MKNKTSGLTKYQHDKVNEFLDLFADVEAALKVRLRRRSTDTTAVKALIEQYAQKNPFWAVSANLLRKLAGIRNLITHERGTLFGYPIAVAPASLKILCRLKEQLNLPEHASVRYRRDVKYVSATDSIAFVLTLAFENGFSQFPVINDGVFGGMITENEIIRWLGREAKAKSVEVNLESISVRMVLKEKDPYLKGITIFHFEKLDSPIEEVMGRFATEPALEVILLTANGQRSTPVEGIITQWDAARYSG